MTLLASQTACTNIIEIMVKWECDILF